MSRPDWLKAPERREVTMTSVDGYPVTALYSPAEAREMTRLREAGTPPRELRFLHELKATFDLDLVLDELEGNPTGQRARAVGAGAAWDD